MRNGCGHLFNQNHRRGIGGKRPFTRQHLKNHHPQRINIAASIQRLPLNLLWAHVTRSADGKIARQRGLAFCQPGNAKIRQIGRAIFVKQNIVGLQVTMHNTFGVGSIQGGGDSADNRNRFINGHRALLQPSG